MWRKLLTISIVFLSLLAFTSLAWSSVVGSWDIYGTLTVRVTIKGHSQTVVGEFTDEFTFYPDGTFTMIDMEGTWTQNKRNFVVYLDPEDIESYFEDGLEDAGLDADVSVTKTTFKGKETKSGSAISGKIKLKMDVYFYDYGLNGKINSSATFIGTPGTFSSGLKKTHLPSRSIIEIIADKLRELISAGGLGALSLPITSLQ